MANGERGRKAKRRKSSPSNKAQSVQGWRAGRPKGTGTQRVYSHVREDIIGLRLPPGSDLDEARLEQRFGVSRTPVREALIRLASDGLIVLLPNRGARVTQIDISDLPQLFEALELTQRATIRWAAIRSNPDHTAELRAQNRRFLDAARQGNTEGMGEANHAFHLVIARACGNRYFESLYVSLLAVSLRLARTCFAYAPLSGEPAQDYYLEIARQHDEMVNAIERRDPDAAEDLARVHTELFRDRIMRYIGSSLAGGVSLQAVG
jgi:DNA-binding GntR family transcriptional regulator